MSEGAGLAATWRKQGITDLIEALRASGFPVGASEAIDATQLLIALGQRLPALEDPLRLCSRLRPVLCKSREQQEQFDPIFDRWWKTLSQRFEPVAPPLPTHAELPEKTSVGKVSASTWSVWIAGFALVAISVAAAFWLWRREPPPSATPAVALPGPTASAPSILPPAEVARGPAIDRYVPAVRYNVELRPVWVWLLGALPFGALFTITLPILVLSHTRLRRRSEPMFLDPAPLALEARRLVPPMPPDVTDRLARHVRSRGIDIERLARRPLIDVRRTIEATLRNHGIPTLQFSVARIHPSYLLLIDVANETDPRGRLFFQWAQRLQQEGLDVEILLLRRAPAERTGQDSLWVCPPELARRAEPQWRPLSQVRAPRFGERLVVVSDGEPLVDASGRWRAEASRSHFHRWRDRSFFTPVEPRDWGRREEAIERSERVADPGFIVLPLEESALGAWMDLVHTGQLSTVTLTDPQRFPALLRQGGTSKFVADEPPESETLERLIQQLRVYLGDQGFYWLAAIAVAPIVRWELTLLLGKAALRRLPRLADEKSLNEALARNYRRLVRLPWLQREVVPDWLRLRLLVELSHAQHGELRTLVVGLFARLSPRAMRYGIELAFERPPGTAVDRRDRSTEHRGSGAEGDALYLGYVSGLSPEQLVLRAPERWAAWAGNIRLHRPSGWRGWLTRIRDRARAEWALWAWTDGLPHLGLNRRHAIRLSLLALPLIVGLAAAFALAPVAPLIASNVYFEEVPHPIVIAAPSQISTVAFSPDGSRIASGSLENTLRLWDAQTGVPIGAPLQGHTHGVESVAFSPDGHRIVSGSRDNTLRLWDAQTGAPIGAPLQGHMHGVESVAFSPDGRRIVSGSRDNTLRLWDAQTGALMGTPLQGHTDEVRSVAFSPDSRRIVSGSRDNTLRLWDAQTAAPIGAPLRGHRDQVSSVAFSPDGRRIVSGSRDNTLRLWDAQTGALMGTPLQGHTDEVRSVAFSPDSRRIVSGSRDNTLRLWDAQTAAPIGAPLRGHANSVQSVAFSPDGRRIVSGSDDKSLRLWDAQTGRPIGAPLQGHTSTVQSVAFSPDGHRIVSGSGDKTLRLWDAQTGEPIGAPLQGHTNMVLSVAFSPDGRRIVSGSIDTTLRLWDAQTGQPIGAPLEGHTDRVLSVAFSPDGRRIASGSIDRTLRLWNTQTGQSSGAPLRGDTNGVLSVAFSPDGRRIVSGGGDKTLRLWDAQTGEPIGAPLQGHTNMVLSVAFSPDGRRIVSGSIDTTLRLWDAQTGQPIGASLRGHTSTVQSVAFSPDGRQIVSGSNDGTLRLWDAQTGEPIGSALPSSGPISSVTISPTGAYAAVATRHAPDEVGAAKPPDKPTQSALQIEQRFSQGLAQTSKSTTDRATPTIQIWRIDPYPTPEPSKGAADGYQTALAFAHRLDGLQLLFWTLGFVIVLLVIEATIGGRRLARVLTQRSPLS